MCSFEENSSLFDEKERAKGPISAFPQQGSPKPDRLLTVTRADRAAAINDQRLSGDKCAGRGCEE